MPVTIEPAEAATAPPPPAAAPPPSGPTILPARLTTNQAPTAMLLPQDGTPIDPYRPRRLTSDATHLVLGLRIGPYHRGDMIGAADFLAGADRLALFVADGVARELNPAELAARPAPAKTTK